MRTYYFDQYEFDSPASEQSLLLIIAKRNQCQNLGQFLQHVTNEHGFDMPVIGESIALNEHSMATFITNHLQRIELEVPPNSPMYVLTEQWNELSVVFELEFQFILHHWETTA